MGDIFRRETAAHPEPFTGERLTTAIGGQVQIEHYHRYLFARAFVAGRDVLDVASGEGYGSALLAQIARRVIGIEHSGPAAQAAAGNFRRHNLHFVQADARGLPLADGCVDVVVSYETIEHFDRHADFLREIRRVLRPDGRLIVSTPDREVYSPVNTAANPFHVRELNRCEFVALLGTTFRHVHLLRQRALIGSALLADHGSAMPPLVFERRGETHFEANDGLPRAPYLVAVASDGELPPPPPSLYVDRADLDTEALRIADLLDTVRQAQSELAEMTTHARCSDAARSIAEQARSAAEQQQAVADEARQAAERAQQAAEQAAEQEQQAANRLRAAAESRIDALQCELSVLRGSLRTFLRGYLPRLRRHLFGHRR